jgi:hypothetical protein
MKSLGAKIGVFAGLGVIILLVGLFMMDMTYDNQEQRLRQDVADQQRKIEANFDKMWKVISQQVQVADKYAGDFKEVCKSWVKGRYGDNGSQAAFQWLKEHNVNIDSSIYKKLMTTIEAERMSFEREQRRLSELAAAHAKIFVTKPSKWFVDGQPVKVEMISSKKTKSIMETGEENDVGLFNKD